jgi:hypothetical protein
VEEAPSLAIASPPPLFINAGSKPARFAIAATRSVTEGVGKRPNRLAQRRLELRVARRNFDPGQFPSTSATEPDDSSSGRLLSFRLLQVVAARVASSDKNDAAFRESSPDSNPVSALCQSSRALRAGSTRGFLHQSLTDASRNSTTGGAVARAGPAPHIALRHSIIFRLVVLAKEGGTSAARFVPQG